jgi:gliding motility associated protien GldN
MKLKKLILAVVIVFGSIASNAQSNLLNAKTPAEIGKKTAAQLESENDKPLPYGYVHDRDVLMGKTTWEIIDLDERINFPMYYPVDTNYVGKDRRSLFQVLLNNIKSGKITEVYGDDYFNTKKSLKDLETVFKYTDTIQAGDEEFKNFYDDYKSGKKVLSPEFINVTYLTAKDIKAYKVKGFWYFDKRQSELKYRLLAICPLALEAKDIAPKQEEPKTGNAPELIPIELFWIYYPSVRDVLHEAKAFNNRNSAMPITFDQLLNSRHFNGVIYKEENVYGDREIQDYMKDNAQMQLLESERVKDKIRDFEQDMWTY